MMMTNPIRGFCVLLALLSFLQGSTPEEQAARFCNWDYEMAPGEEIEPQPCLPVPPAYCVDPWYPELHNRCTNVT